MDIRFNKAERYQHEYRDVCLDELISDNHQVRSLWAYVCSLDLSSFHAGFEAVEGKAGRRPVDPAILLTLWLYAIIEGISSGRQLARLCRRDAVLMWICGHVGVNYNLLNNFRVNHMEALQELMTQTLAVLHQQGLIDFKRVSQDGIRVRANAGTGSFRRKETLQEFLREAGDQVESTLAGLDEATSEQEKAAQVHAALDRQRRIEEALRQHEELAKQRESRKKGDGEKTRASITDPDARNMKMADGGFRPAFNIQAATLNDSRLVVGVEATNAGTDSGQMAPMLDFIESTFGQRPEEILADGGYNSRQDITDVQRSGTKVFSPVRKPRKSEADPHERRHRDSEEVAQWRQRMKTEQAKEIYQERCLTAEFPFARFRNHGLGQLPVRGTVKAKGIGLWHALVHNFQQIMCKGWLIALTG